jgi:hypothetical protein
MMQNALIFGDAIAAATNFVVTAGTCANLSNLADRRLAQAADITMSGSGTFSARIDFPPMLVNYAAALDIRNKQVGSGISISLSFYDAPGGTLLGSSSLASYSGLPTTSATPFTSFDDIGDGTPVTAGSVTITAFGLNSGSYSIGRLFAGIGETIEIAEGWELAVRERATVQRNRGAQTVRRAGRRFREISTEIVGLDWSTFSPAGASLHSRLTDAGVDPEVALILRMETAGPPVSKPIPVAGIVKQPISPRPLADGFVSLPLTITESL